MVKVIAVSVCFIMASLSSCISYRTHDDNVAMVEMIKNGADAIDAKCAVKGEFQGICAIRAATKNK